MRRCLGSILLACFSAVPAKGQQALVDQLDRELEREASTSPTARALEVERLIALSSVDLRVAAEAAETLWADAETRGEAGVAAAAAAVAGLARFQIDGVPGAAPWRDRAEPFPGGAPAVEAAWCIARARDWCQQGEHATETRLLLSGFDTAESAGDWRWQLRLAQATTHALPVRGIARFRRLLEQPRAGALDELHARAVSLAAELSELSEELFFDDPAATAVRMDRLEEEARALGDRASLARLAWSRAELSRGNDGADASDLLAQWRERAQEMGDAHGVCFAVDLLAEVAVEAGDTESARRWIDEIAQSIEGKGWDTLEYNLLATRFDLALRERDGEAAGRISEQLDALTEEDTPRDRAWFEMLDDLAAESARSLELEAQLRDATLAQTERERSLWMWGGLVVASFLVVLLGVSVYAHRRLSRANRDLAEQVARTDDALQAQVQLEDQLRHLERTEGLGRLAAGIAHDFNNLLTGISGSAELLRVVKDDAERERLIDLVLAAGDQGARLCRQLRENDESEELDLHPIDLLTLVREVRTSLLAATNRSVAVEIDGRSQSVVASIDRSRIEQMLLNFVLNAKEANASRVSILVECARSEDGGPGARIEVRDNGRGMSAEVASRIFDPFFTTRFPGRGLGLAVVFGSVRRHGGQIHVDSTEGEGSTFRVELPVSDRPVEIPAVPPQAPSVDRHGENGLVVWVVDDEPDVRTVLRSMLEIEGLTVRDAAEGSGVRAHLTDHAENSPTWWFVDLTLPGTDVLRLCEEIRGARPAARIVLMSGHLATELDRAAQAIEPAAVLPKPFTFAALRQCLGKLAGEPASTAS